MDAGGEDDRAKGYAACEVRLSKEGGVVQAVRVRKGPKFDTMEGVRSRSTVSLSPAMPKAAPVSKVSLW